MRNTKTGSVLEAMVVPALVQGSYTSNTQVKLGHRCGGGKQIVDLIARNKANETILISLKWQQVKGAAEQKVPFEVCCLANSIRSGLASRSYLVLGGEGWTLKDYYVSGGLDEYLQYSHLVKILTLESFVALANKSQL